MAGGADHSVPGEVEIRVAIFVGHSVPLGKGVNCANLLTLTGSSRSPGHRHRRRSELQKSVRARRIGWRIFTRSTCLPLEYGAHRWTEFPGPARYYLHHGLTRGAGPGHASLAAVQPGPYPAPDSGHLCGLPAHRPTMVGKSGDASKGHHHIAHRRAMPPPGILSGQDGIKRVTANTAGRKA